MAKTEKSLKWKRTHSEFGDYIGWHFLEQDDAGEVRLNYADNRRVQKGKTLWHRGVFNDGDLDITPKICFVGMHAARLARHAYIELSHGAVVLVRGVEGFGNSKVVGWGREPLTDYVDLRRIVQAWAMRVLQVTIASRWHGCARLRADARATLKDVNENGCSRAGLVGSVSDLFEDMPDHASRQLDADLEKRLLRKLGYKGALGWVREDMRKEWTDEGGR